MYKVKLIALFVAMISLGASAFTSLTGWANTPFEYNAYFQGLVAIGIFIWLCHKAIQTTEVRLQKPIKNSRKEK